MSDILSGYEHKYSLLVKPSKSKYTTSIVEKFAGSKFLKLFQKSITTQHDVKRWGSVFLRHIAKVTRRYGTNIKLSQYVLSSSQRFNLLKVLTRLLR